MQKPEGRCVPASPSNSRKATVTGVKWEGELSVEDEVRQRGQTRSGLADSCTKAGFTLSNLNTQRRVKQTNDMASLMPFVLALRTQQVAVSLPPSPLIQTHFLRYTLAWITQSRPGPRMEKEKIISVPSLNSSDS